MAATANLRVVQQRSQPRLHYWGIYRWCIPSHAHFLLQMHEALALATYLHRSHGQASSLSQTSHTCLPPSARAPNMNMARQLRKPLMGLTPPCGPGRRGDDIFRDGLLIHPRVQPALALAAAHQVHEALIQQGF